MSRSDPIRKVFTDVPGAKKRQPSSAHGITEPEVAKANIRKRSDIREHFEINTESRVKKTNVNLGSV